MKQKYNNYATEKEIHSDILSIITEFEKGNTESAIELLLTSENKSPEKSVFPLCRGNILRLMGQSDQALAAYELSALCHDASEETFYVLAGLLQEQGKLKKARFFYSKITPIDALYSNSVLSIEEIDRLIAQSQRKQASHLIWLDADSRYPAPYVGFTARPHGEGGRLNAWGFPGAEPPSVEKQPDETRVFILGDSCVFDNDIDSNKTLTDYVQEDLLAYGLERVKVYNFGVRSSVAHQMLSLLLFKLVDYKPDVVVICCGGSNIFAPLSFDPRPGAPYNFYAIEEVYSQFFDFRNIDIESVSVDYQSIVDGLSIRHAELRKKVGHGSSEWDQSIVEAFDSFIDKAARVASSYQLDISVALQPMVNTKKNLSEEEEKMVKNSTFDYFSRQYERLEKLFANKNNEQKNPFFNLVNLSKVFDGEDAKIFTDFIHYNQSGKLIMAQNLSALIRQRLDLHKTPQSRSLAYTLNLLSRLFKTRH